ncbi:hypothetical protein FACS189434_06470 [Bacteroidia bacterium]|nr:hypothetical protein FACS189434_06470 [Bacteroidia bacterium]
MGLNRENAKIMHDVLTANNFDVGDYGTFEKNIQDPAKRKQLFDVATAHNFDLGDETTYNQKLGFDKEKGYFDDPTFWDYAFKPGVAVKAAGERFIEGAESLASGVVRTGNSLINATSKLGAAMSGSSGITNPYAQQYRYLTQKSEAEEKAIVDRGLERVRRNYQAGVELADNISAYANRRYGTKTDESGNTVPKDYSDLWQEGRYFDSVNQALNKGFESAPSTLMAMNPISAPLIYIDVANQKYEQLKQNNPEMSEEDMLLNAGFTGLVEYLSERAGGVLDIKLIKNIIGKVGKSASAKLFGQAAVNAVLGMAGEGGEEIISNTGENIIDKLSGVKKDGSIWDGTRDAFVYGVAGAGPVSVGGQGIGTAIGYHNLRNQQSVEREVQINKAVNPQLPQDFDLSPESIAGMQISSKKAFDKMQQSLNGQFTFNPQIIDMSAAHQKEYALRVMSDAALSAEQKQSVLNYMEVANLAKQTAARREQNIYAEREQTAERLRSRVNNTTGTIVTAQVEGVDNPVEILSGLRTSQQGEGIVMPDLQGSDEIVYYRDGSIDEETGQPRVMPIAREKIRAIDNETSLDSAVLAENALIDERIGAENAEIAQYVNASTSLSNRASTSLSNRASTSLSNRASTSLSNRTSTSLSNRAADIDDRLQMTIDNENDDGTYDVTISEKESGDVVGRRKLSSEELAPYFPDVIADTSASLSNRTSASLGNRTSADGAVDAERAAFYEGLPVDNKGRIDEALMSAEQKIRYAQYELGDQQQVAEYIADQQAALDAAIDKLNKKQGKTVAERKELINLQAQKAVFDASTSLSNQKDAQTQDKSAATEKDIEDFNDKNSFYRVIVGDAAFEDLVNSGVVRTSGKPKPKPGKIDLDSRPTAFPSFSKGEVSIHYAQENPNNYIIVTNDKSMQPSISGRHGKGSTFFPTDSNGKHLRELDGKNVEVYKHIGDGKYELVYANGILIENTQKNTPANSEEKAGVNTAGLTTPLNKETKKATPAETDFSKAKVGEKNKTAKEKPKKINQKKLKAFDREAMPVSGKIIYDIAGGKKFIWNNVERNGNILSYGLKSSLFGKATHNDRNSYFNIIASAEKGGLTIEQYAHQLWEEGTNGEDDALIRDEIIETLKSVNSSKIALQKLEDIYYEKEQEVPDDSSTDFGSAQPPSLTDHTSDNLSELPEELRPTEYIPFQIMGKTPRTTQEAANFAAEQVEGDILKLENAMKERQREVERINRVFAENRQQKLFSNLHSTNLFDVAADVSRGNQNAATATLKAEIKDLKRQVDELKAGKAAKVQAARQAFDQQQTLFQGEQAHNNPAGRLTKISDKAFEKLINWLRRTWLFKGELHTGHEFANRILGEGGYFAMIEAAELSRVNARFNDAMQAGKIQGKTFELGIPSPTVQATGVTKPYKLHGDLLEKKIKKHGYKPEDLKDLPLHLASPIAVFDGSEADTRAILTEMKIGNNNVLVSVEINKDGEIDFSFISSVYDKGGKGIVWWINNEKGKFFDKEKALNYLHSPALIAEISNNKGLSANSEIDTAKVQKEIETAIKKVQNFENPKLSEEKLQSLRLMSLWHGTGTDFDQFLKEKFLTGEGSMAYGAGHYFTDKKSIAENYANNSNNRNRNNEPITINGEDFRNYINKLDPQFAIQIPTNADNLQDLIYYVDKAYLDGRIAGQKSKRAGEFNKQKYKFLSDLQHGEITGFNTNQKQILKVKIHGDKTTDELNFLRWDKEATPEQKEKIINEIEKDNIPNSYNYQYITEEELKYAESEELKRLIERIRKADTGQKIYGAIENYIAGNEYGYEYNDIADKEKASEFLLAAGIDGIQYPTEFQSRGQHEDSFNYVVFDENAIEIEEKIRLLATPKGEIYGFVTADGKDMWIDKDLLNANTPIHEFGHLWVDYIEQNNKELYDKGAELIKQTKYYRDLADNPYYAKMTEKQKIGEAMATAIGDNGEAMLLDLSPQPLSTREGRNAVTDLAGFAKVRAWLNNVWKKIGAALKIRNLNADQISKLSLQEFLDGAVADLLGGQEIAGHTSTSLSNRTSTSLSNRTSTSLSNRTSTSLSNQARNDGRDLKTVRANIAAAEAETDTNPTEAQKEVGNYKKGHLKIQGFDISIEQPKGSVRRGVDENGKAWESKMHNTYGYFGNTESRDGDHIDVFLGENPLSERIFVIDQIDSNTGAFDEHKVMFGFENIDEAKKAYLANYEKGWQGLGNITETDVETFRDWAKAEGKRIKPFAEYKGIAGRARNDGAAQAREIEEFLNNTEDGQKLVAQAIDETAKAKQQADKVSSFIKDVLDGKIKDGKQEIELPEYANRLAEQKLGHKIDSHSIRADEIRHINNRHGINGAEKDNPNNIPLRKEDIALIPYIMGAPDRIEKRPSDSKGRESIRYIKDINNGKIVVVEREISPDNGKMENITMWATKNHSTGANSANLKGTSAYTPETPTGKNDKPSSYATNVRNNRPSPERPNTLTISQNDAAKIRKDFKTAIEREQNLSKQTLSLMAYGKFQSEIDEDGIYELLEKNTEYTNEPTDILQGLEKYYGGKVVAGSSGARHALESGLIPFSGNQHSGNNGEYHHLRFEDENGNEWVEAVPFETPEKDADGRIIIRDNTDGKTITYSQPRFHISITPDGKAKITYTPSSKNGGQEVAADQADYDFDVTGITEQNAQEMQAIKKASPPALSTREGAKYLAPNGKPSNLNEREWLQVRTQSFIDWFGDWINDPENASKVVDENGEPLKVAHNTNKDFYEFRDKQKNDSGWLGAGYYFFGDRSLDGQYGKNVMETFLDIKNPYYATQEDVNRLSDINDNSESEEFTQELQGEGYDGVYFNGNLNQEWVAFNPNQIKSATSNNGNFDDESGDIRFMANSLDNSEKSSNFAADKNGNFYYGHDRQKARLGNRGTMDERTVALALGKPETALSITRTLTETDADISRGAGTGTVYSGSPRQTRGERSAAYRAALEKNARANNAWVDDVRSVAQGELDLHSGSESEVYYGADGKNVVKVNDLEYTTSPEDIVYRTAAHNQLFPEDKITIVGFGKNSKGNVSVLQEQAFVTVKKDGNGNPILATPEQIDNYMVNVRGAERIGNIGDGAYRLGEFEVRDLHPNNVLLDTEGNLRFIDTFIIPQEGAGGSTSLTDRGSTSLTDRGSTSLTDRGSTSLTDRGSTSLNNRARNDGGSDDGLRFMAVSDSAPNSRENNSDKPVREAGENLFDFAVRVNEWNKNNPVEAARARYRSFLNDREKVIAEYKSGKIDRSEYNERLLKAQRSIVDEMYKIENLEPLTPKGEQEKKAEQKIQSDIEAIDASTSLSNRASTSFGSAQEPSLSNQKEEDSFAGLPADLVKTIREIKNKKKEAEDLPKIKKTAQDITDYIRAYVGKDIVDMMNERDFKSLINKIETSTSKGDLRSAVNAINTQIMSIVLRKNKNVLNGLIDGKILNTFILYRLEGTASKQTELDNYSTDTVAGDVSKLLSSIKSYNNHFMIQAQNKRGVSVAKNVDESTRQIIQFIRDNYKLADTERLKTMKEEIEEKTNKGEGTPEDIRKLIGIEFMNKMIELKNTELDIKDLKNTDYHEFAGTGKRKWEHILDRQKDLEKLQVELIEEFTDLYETGMSKLAAWVETQEDRWKAQADEALAAVNDKPVKNQKKIKEESNLQRIARLTAKGLAKTFYYSPIGSFEFMLQYIDRNHPKGKGKMYQRWMAGKDGMVAASDKKDAGFREYVGTVKQKAEEIFGKKFEDVVKDTRKDSGETLTYTDYNHETKTSEQITIPMTKGEMMYVWMTWQHEQGREKLEGQYDDRGNWISGMGITQKDIDDIAENLGEEYIKFANWIQNDFLTKTREKYNKTHIDVFGTSMGKILGYFPLRYSEAETPPKADVDGINYDLPSTMTGAIINRTKNTKQIKLDANFIDVLMEHGEQMESWNAYAKLRKDLNKLLNNINFKNHLKANDETSFERFQAAAKIAVDANQPNPTDMEQGYMNVVRKLQGAAIAGRINTALKQSTALAAYSFYSASPKYHTKIWNNVFNPKRLAEDYKWAMDNLPTFAERIGKGSFGNEKLDTKPWEDSRRVAGKDNYFGKFGKAINDASAYLTEKGMLPNKSIDAFIFSLGSRAIYDYEFERYQEQGFSKEAAREKALFDAANYSNKTAQSSNLAYLSPLQKSKTFWAVSSSAFMNANFAFLRNQTEGWLQIATATKQIKTLTRENMDSGMSAEAAEKAARKEVLNANGKAVMKILYSGFVTNAIFQMFDTAFSALLSSGDDDDDEIKRKLIATWTSPINNLLGGNSILAIAGGYEPTDLLNSEINKAVRELRKAAKEDYFNAELTELAIKTALKLGLGLNVETVMNVYEGIERGIVKGGGALMAYQYATNVPQSVRIETAKKIQQGESIYDFANRVSLAYMSDSKYEREQKQMIEKYLFNVDGSMEKFNDAMEEAKKWDKLRVKETILKGSKLEEFNEMNKKKEQYQGLLNLDKNATKEMKQIISKPKDDDYKKVERRKNEWKEIMKNWK